MRSHIKCVAAHPSSECCLVKKVTFVQKMLLPSCLKCISKHYNCTDIVQCSAVYIYIYMSVCHIYMCTGQCIAIELSYKYTCHHSCFDFCIHIWPTGYKLLMPLEVWTTQLSKTGSSCPFWSKAVCTFLKIWPYPSYSSDFTLATSNTLHSIQNFSYVSVPSLAHPLGLISFNPTLTLLPSLFFIYSKSPPLPFNC